MIEEKIKGLSAPELVHSGEMVLLGMNRTMSLQNNQTGELWQTFMMNRNRLPAHTGTNLYSVQCYDPDYFTAFAFDRTFVKWAAIRPDTPADPPEGYQMLKVPEGWYAVFQYRGSDSNAPALFRYIFTGWLPGSGYSLDNRPHFEILGPGYKRNDPESEESIWIPVRKI